MEAIPELRSITCHMKSHSVTCHPTQMNVPCLNSSQTGRYSIYLPRRNGRLSWPRQMVTYRLPRWFICPQAVTHPSTNPARRRLTSLIGHNALSLCHSTNPNVINENNVSSMLAQCLNTVDPSTKSCTTLTQTCTLTTNQKLAHHLLLLRETFTPIFAFIVF